MNEKRKLFDKSKEFTVIQSVIISGAYSIGQKAI
jgi:hypothetical protein